MQVITTHADCIIMP